MIQLPNMFTIQIQLVFVKISQDVGTSLTLICLAAELSLAAACHRRKRGWPRTCHKDYFLTSFQSCLTIESWSGYGERFERRSVER